MDCWYLYIRLDLVLSKSVSGLVRCDKEGRMCGFESLSFVFCLPVVSLFDAILSGVCCEYVLDKEERGGMLSRTASTVNGRVRLFLLVQEVVKEGMKKVGRGQK